MSSSEHGSKAVIAALLANLGIAVAKLVGFVITGSASMLAESIHSVADSGNQGLLLLGGKRASRDEDESHPFGYGRERYFWSFVVALVLFSLGGAFALAEGISKIRHPHEVSSAGVGVGILFVAVLLESWSFRTAVRAANPARGDATWWEYIRHSKSPELPVVLLEDLGALAGLTIALAAVVASLVTGDAIWDGLGTTGIGVLLTMIAVVLAVEMKSLLIGESASPGVRATIRLAIEQDPDVERLIHHRTEHLGPDQLLVGAKVSFARDLTMTDISDAVNRIEQRIRTEVPAVGIVYIEPDVYQLPETPTSGRTVP